MEAVPSVSSFNSSCAFFSDCWHTLDLDHQIAVLSNHDMIDLPKRLLSCSKVLMLTIS